MGPYSRRFHLENCWVQFTVYNPLLCGYPIPPPSTPIYVRACGVDKNNLKWQEIQLAVDCGVGSLIGNK